MPERASKDVREQWKKNILKQRESGLSIASWCKQNHIAVHAFYYWRDKLFPAFDRSDFSEISEKQKVCNQKAGIYLECQGIRIFLEPQFDCFVLKKCLEAIKEIKC